MNNNRGGSGLLVKTYTAARDVHIGSGLLKDLRNNDLGFEGEFNCVN